MSGGSKMLWSVDEGAGKTPSQAAVVQSESRPALDIPPSLRGTIEVPDAGGIAVHKKIPKRYQATLKGKKVALDARLYDASTGSVFSAVIDGMGALNLPVQSIDSASGTITTDWIRTDANNPNVNTLLNAFGGGGPQAIRYRYVARVLRESLETAVKTRLEIRTMAQTYQNGHWTNKKLARKRANELFSSVEEMLAK
ncbi:MAG: hypothetical protein Q9M20_07505 [Mariprofundaceae bacterium]|nr:hypothetical protein [Mariprofundaceae bacterium]